MFCPQCGEEFAWHVMVCPRCDVDTVDRLPGPEPTPEVQLVSVLATGDAGVIAIARTRISLLQSRRSSKARGLTTSYEVTVCRTCLAWAG